VKNNTNTPFPYRVVYCQYYEFDILCNISISNTQYIGSKWFPQLSLMVIKVVFVFNNLFQNYLSNLMNLFYLYIFKMANVHNHRCSIYVTGNTNHKPKRCFLRYTCRQSIRKTSNRRAWPMHSTPDPIWQFYTGPECPMSPCSVKNVCIQIRKLMWLNTVWTLYTVSCKNNHG
jgi:hypothetical protein